MEDMWTTTVKRGDIYWVRANFDRFTDSDSAYNDYPKIRPAVIVSNDAGNNSSGCVEIVYLTGKDKKELPTHTTIINPGLRCKSTVMCEQITTIPKTRLRNKIGECSSKQMRDIDACLAISLGIDRAEPEENPGVYMEAQMKGVVDEKNATIEKMKKEIDRLTKQVEVIEELYICSIEYKRLYKEKRSGTE